MTLWNEQSSPRLAFFRRWWGWIVTLSAALTVAVLMVAWEKPVSEPVAAVETPVVSEPVTVPGEPVSTAIPEPKATSDEMKASPPVENAPAETQDEGMQPAEPESNDELKEKITALEKRVSDLEARESGKHSNSLYGALYKLRLRFERGEHADDVLVQMMDQNLNEEQQALVKTLASLNQDGIDATSKLTSQFSELADRMPIAENNSGSFIGKAENWAQEHVVIRKVGEEHIGNDDESIIARAEAHLHKGELALALKEMDGASESAKLFFASWRVRAEHRLAAMETLAALEHSITEPAVQP